MSDASEVTSYRSLCDSARASVTQIDAGACEGLVAAGHLVIDLREPEERALGVIPGTIPVPRGLLEKSIVELAPDPRRTVCLYCARGNRSALAGRVLQEMGYEDVRSLDGGFDGWLGESRPVSVPPATERIEREGGFDPGNWESIRAAFPIVGRSTPVLDGTERPLVYLDHAATTHPPQLALEAVSHFLGLEYANVHRANYQLARTSTLRFEDAYRTCATFVGADLDHHCVVFTANTTAACEIVAHAVAPLPGAVVVTDLEHHSSDLPYRRRGRVLRVGLDEEQRLDLNVLREVLRRDR
ncbi:MAG: aminotransferase class V-fold PLP-dependent enzyme, partial [Planctomycetota bacterium]|nr:aminotransferase class V-fold PLP-dependent enzyme [Planctomycetota bacterium]